MSDADLIRRAIHLDVQVFADVIRRHERPVFSYLARRAGASAAEDLLSEVWAVALENLSSYDTARSSARPWLFGIARNRLRSYWRSNRAGEPAIEQCVDPWPDVDERLVARGNADRLRQAVDGLRDAERETLLLVVWEQLTPAEVGVVMGVPAGTVRSRLHRARADLRARLDQHGGPHITAREQ
jgi:RNA polymerase sigma factor (sigma-70 family)